MFATLLFAMLLSNPFRFAVQVYHAAVHVVEVPVDALEYVTGTPLHKVADALHFVAAKADYYLDEANHESHESK